MPLPFVKANFEASGVRVPARRFSLTREAGRHEVAVIRVNDHPLSRFETGSPVSVLWGDYPRIMNTFVGYVHHAEPIFDRNDDRFRRPKVDVVCVGMTGPLAEPRSRSWLHTRLDLIVEEAATEARVLAVTEKSDEVLSGIVQPGVSSWKFMSERAKEAGMVLFAHGSRVYLITRSKAVESLRDHAPVFTQSSMIDFDGVVGELNVIGREAVEREAYGIGADGIVVGHTDRSRVQTKTDRPFNVMRKIMVGGASHDGAGLARSVRNARRYEDFLHEVKFTVPQIERLTVCSPVYLDEFGSRYDGVWSVSRVRFEVEEDAMTTTVKAIKSPEQHPPTPPSKSGVYTSTVFTLPEKDSVRLVGSRWVAMP